MTLTPVLASHWILRIVLANQRPPLPLVARNIQPMSLSKITLQRPFLSNEKQSKKLEEGIDRFMIELKNIVLWVKVIRSEA